MVLIGLLGLVAGIGWWQFPSLLKWGIDRTLQQYGLSDIQVNSVRADSSLTTIEQLDFSYQESSTLVQVQLTELALRYDLAELVSGQAKSLEVGAVAVKLDHQPEAQADTSAKLPKIELLLEAFDLIDLAAIPVDAVNLPKITITHNLVADSSLSFDTLELRAELAKLASKTTLHIYSAEQQSLQWSSDQQSGWLLRYFDSSASDQAIFTGTINRVGDSLVFSAELAPSFTQGQIFTLDTALEFSALTIDGTVAGSQSLSGLAVTWTVMAAGIRLGEDGIQTLNAEVDLDLTQSQQTGDSGAQNLQLILNTGSTLSLKDLRYQGWSADQGKFNVAGSLAFAHDEVQLHTPTLNINFDQLVHPDYLALPSLSFKGGISASANDQQWQLEIAKSSQLSSESAMSGDIELPQGFSISTIESTSLSGTFESSGSELPEDGAIDKGDEIAEDAAVSSQAPSLKLDKASFKLALPMLADKSLSQQMLIGSASFRLDRAQFDHSGLRLTGAVSIPQLTLEEPDNNNAYDWLINNIEQSFELNADQLTAQGTAVSLARDLAMTTTTKHDFAKQQGDSRFNVKAIEFNDAKRLNQLTAPFKLPVKLVAGELKLSGQARWANKRGEWQTVVDMNAQLLELGGAYEETYFSGVNGQLPLQVYPQQKTNKPSTITVKQADAGVPNTDMLFEFSLSPSKLGDLPIVNVVRATSNLLQGTASLEPGLFDLNRDKQSLRVMLEKIDLNELVRLQQLEDITATGLVSGQLPLLLNDGKISIDDGQIYALAPGGTLRYTANSDALKANKYAETVMRALENFNYDVLSADTEYDPDGTLLLKLRLQGKNPDFEQGRQVNLNVNLEQNVLKLFESLRLIDGVSDRLDQRVQQFYEQTTSP